MVLDGREGRAFDRVGGGTLVFSPNSARFGHVARLGNASFVVVDDVRKPRYDMVGYLTFSPDSRRCVYAATKGAEAFTIVDQRECNTRYEQIWTVPDARFPFSDRAAFQYLGLKQDALYLVTEQIR